MAIIQRIIVLFWALAASLLTLFLIGFSHFFSSLFDMAYLSMAVEISFIILTVIYALIFKVLFKKNMSFIAAALAFLPPIIVFWLILFS